MTFRPVLVTPPASELVSASELATHLGVDAVSEFEPILRRNIAAATAKIDGYHGILGRCMVTQTWRATFDAWSSDSILCLPVPDVSAISSVKYYDADGVDQTVSSSLYELLADAEGSYIKFLSGFSSPSLSTGRSDVVRVEFVAGYGDADQVPADVVLAVMFLAGHWFQNREGQGEVPPQVENLLSRHWVVKL